MEDTQQLQQSDSPDESTFGLSIEKPVIFSDHKGKYKKGIEKYQTKWLKLLQPIKPFFAEDEKILHVAPACSPMSFMEQYLMGGIIFYIKRCLLVFTNKRIIHVLTDMSYRYRDSLSEIRYSDCKKILIRSHGLRFFYGNGKKEIFYYVDRRSRKKIKTLLPGLTLGGEGASEGHRDHLCPQCQATLERDVYECRKCFLKFKNKEEGKKISWLLPGGGYFYTRHPFLGVGDAIAEVFLILLIIGFLINVQKGIEDALAGLIVFLIALFLEKLVTVFEASHFIDEYIPIEKQIEQK